jgi:predicted nucleic acid-binding protein
MSVECFLDTNVILYRASKDPADAEKAMVADRLIRNTRFGTSFQVAQEFYHNSRVKARLGILASEAEAIITVLLRRPCVTMDARVFAEARRICERWQFRYWDAAMLAAAKALNAPIFYSEDLTHGQMVDGVEIVNPFAKPFRAAGAHGAPP